MAWTADRIDRVVAALERIADALERAHPKPSTVQLTHRFDEGDKYEGPYGYGSQER